MKIAFPRLVLIAASLAAGPTLAYAQGFDRIGGNAPGPTTASKAAPPPAALPGAASNPANAAPPNRVALDMEPNEALFDSINRGDIGAARDAISRGADLSAHNILGMTPMELSVDLGRNDISFLLLSMRGGDNPRNRRPPGNTAEQLVTKSARQAVRQPVKQVRAAAGAAAVAGPAPRQNPRLFANDGGAPNPNAGFLGFGGGSNR